MEKQARVVQKVDNDIHRINHYPALWITWFVKLSTLVHWIAIYSVNSIIQPLDNKELATYHLLALSF